MIFVQLWSTLGHRTALKGRVLLFFQCLNIAMIWVVHMSAQIVWRMESTHIIAILKCWKSNNKTPVIIYGWRGSVNPKIPHTQNLPQQPRTVHWNFAPSKCLHWNVSPTSICLHWNLCPSYFHQPPTHKLMTAPLILGPMIMVNHAVVQIDRPIGKLSFCKEFALGDFNLSLTVRGKCCVKIVYLWNLYNVEIGVKKKNDHYRYNIIYVLLQRGNPRWIWRMNYKLIWNW